MKLTNQMTVSEETELKGLDVILHGETAYQILEDGQNQVNNSNRKVMIFLTQFRFKIFSMYRNQHMKAPKATD